MHRRCRLSLAAASIVASVAAVPLAAAGDFSTSDALVATVNTAAWVGNSTSTYGRAINNNSFATSVIQTYNGYQYTAYWQNVSNGGRVALARRAVGASTWQTFSLTGSTLSNGPNDAHNVISLGLNPTDGTIHLAYDMHGHTLKYRVSNQNLLANPASVTWNASLFSAAQQSWLVNSSSTIGGVTYPMFVSTPDNNLQFAYRNGSSGNGSWFFYDYSGATHAWSNGRQIDDGTVGTYTGTVTVGDGNRNNYPNGFTYDKNGRLHSVFTWREGATGAANHDLMYVYSDDGGNIWRNNAGTVVANKSTGQKFSLNTPGLIVRALDESQTLMNQQGQNVDGANRIHSLGWHRDPAKDPSTSTSTPWEPQESSYYHNWRDEAGNWHETKLPGNVGARPKIYFDADDNAWAIYQGVDGGGNLTGGTGSNLYFTNGDLVVAAASKASNWTDWKIVKVEQGNFVSEAQGEMRLRDPNVAGSKDVFTVIMQASPTQTGNTGTTLRTYDYELGSTAPTTFTFNAAEGNFATTSDWTNHATPGLNALVRIDAGNVATVNSAVAALDNRILVGTGGTAGTLHVADGATLDLLHDGPLPNSQYGGSIVVGADAGSVGAYEQTGGTVSAWRFAVGDYSTTTSGGGVSSASITGGSLTTYNLDVAFSANASSSGSSLTIGGNANVNVIGEVILGEFGNAATMNLVGGTLTVAGNIREGFNGTNTSTLVLDGGTLDMTGARIDVDNLQLKNGTIRNLAGTRGTGTIVRNDPDFSVVLGGNNTFSNAIQIDAGVVRAISAMALGNTVGNTVIAGDTTSGRLELGVGFIANESITLGGRQPVATGQVNAPHIVNVSGNTQLNGTISMAVGGNQYTFRSDAGNLTIGGNILNSLGSSPTDVRFINLQGAGNGNIQTNLADSVVGGVNAAKTAVVKTGAGRWNLNGFNTYTGITKVEAGSLLFGSNNRNVLTNAGGLDIAGGRAIFDYSNSGSPSPVPTVIPLLVAGFQNGFTTGQIRSSNASADYGLGWVDIQGDRGEKAFHVVYALYGDANLDGGVAFDDLLALAQNYGSTTATWSTGDFNYDGNANFDDLLAVAQHYGSTLTSLTSDASFVSDWALAQAMTPEPGLLSAIAAVASPLLRRRRYR